MGEETQILDTVTKPQFEKYISVILLYMLTLVYSFIASTVIPCRLHFMYILEDLFVEVAYFSIVSWFKS